jgi:hypothetical protein
MSLVLSGTVGVSDVDGSAATPAIRGTDTNTGIFFPAADTIAFAEGGAEIARFNSAGNQLLGTTTSPSSTLIRQVNAGDGVYSQWTRNVTTIGGGYVGTDGAGLILGTHSGNVGSESYAERARITSAGQFLFRTTAAPTGAWNTNSLVNFQSGLQLTHTGNANIWRQISWSGDTADAALFFPGGSSIGTTANVAILSAAGAWTNASDGRQKTNVQELDYGLETVMQVKPRRYNRIDVAGNYIGFVAQELKTIIPEVVLGSDETSYGVSYGELVAVAFKAIQEQQALIQTLTARVEALEGAQQ